MAHHDPASASKSRKHAAAPRPTLRLDGGLGRFLSPRRTPSSGYTAGQARFARVRNVVKSDVAFENGLGTTSPGSHLLLGHSEPGDPANRLALGDFLSPN